MGVSLVCELVLLVMFLCMCVVFVGLACVVQVKATHVVVHLTVVSTPGPASRMRGRR